MAISVFGDRAITSASGSVEIELINQYFVILIIDCMEECMKFCSSRSKKKTDQEDDFSFLFFLIRVLGSGLYIKLSYLIITRVSREVSLLLGKRRIKGFMFMTMIDMISC